MMKKKIIALAFGVVAMAAAFTAGSSIVKAEASDNETIEDGVCIGNVNVGGMTESEAKDAIDDYLNNLNGTTFTLVGANGSMDISASDMGITSDADAAVEEAMAVGHTGNLITRYKEVTDLKSENITISMHLSIDKQATAQAIYDNQDTLNIEATDATLTRENGQFVYVAGQEGQEVNIVDSVNSLNDYLSTEWDGQTTSVDLVVDTVEPKGSQEELAEIKDLLGTFTTNYSSSAAGRATNVSNGCSKINGSILYPGEEFSVYQTVSPFSEENGYALAGMYENGQVVESLGGGICQVATTLYNAVIRAELEVTMRYNHSMMVSYVDPSDDAAIAGEYKDFRFVNNYDKPIYIEGYCSGGYITFNIYGVETRDANRTVSFESEVLSKDDETVEFNFDSSQDLGYWNVEQSAHVACSAQLWKIVTVDGVEQSREVFNKSTYKASPKIITVGTKGATSKQIKAMKKAAKEEEGAEAAVKSAMESAKSANKDKKKKSDDSDDDDDDEDSSDDSSSTDETTDGTTDATADTSTDGTADTTVQSVYQALVTTSKEYLNQY